MNVSVIGAGHVGLVTGACLAELGHKVIMVDNDRKKLARLKKGDIWFYEPGLEALVNRCMKQKRISFTSSIATAVKKSQIIFISVATPTRESGESDLTAVEFVAREIAGALTSYRLIVEKSTVPVQTGEWMRRTLANSMKRKVPFDVASNPEFLREGSGVEDFMKPDRIVLGVESKRAKELLLELYQPLHAPVIVTDIKSAELIKHASNSFLALKISYINSVAQICDIVGADVVRVADGMGLDLRIGRPFLNAGVGYGGSCFPKDVAAFIHIADTIGHDFRILKAVSHVNDEQKRLFVRQIADSMWNLKGKTVGILGLAFKPETDDLRDAPALEIIRMLHEEGVRIRVYDPKAKPQPGDLPKGVTVCKKVYDVAKEADCLAVLTEWNEFKDLDFARIKKLMRQPVIMDGRNMYKPERLRNLGFRYAGIGRGKQEAV